jgi:hypothetical protein
MKRRKITVLWVEVDLKGNPRVYVLRNRTEKEFSELLAAYTPSPSSLRRMTRLAHSLSENALQPFTCAISIEPKILVGWSLIREERLYIPPQLAA